MLPPKLLMLPVLVLSALAVVDAAAVVSAAPALVGVSPEPKLVVAGVGEHAARDMAESAVVMAFMAPQLRRVGGPRLGPSGGDPRGLDRLSLRSAPQYYRRVEAKNSPASPVSRMLNEFTTTASSSPPALLDLAPTGSTLPRQTKGPQSIVLIAAIAVSCTIGPKGSVESGESSTVGTASMATATKSDSDSVPTTNSPTTNGVSDTHSDGDHLPDVGSEPPQRCDLAEQSCPTGQKCNPSGIGTGFVLTGLSICVPVLPDPKHPDSACSFLGDDLDGTDDCDIGTVCVASGSDPPDMGTCRTICNVDGKPAPTCPSDHECFKLGCASCYWSICKRPCDPRETASCPTGDECLPSDLNTFNCVGDLSGDEGQAGDPCEFANACDPGLFCLDADKAPGCDGDATGCCTSFCSIDLPNMCPNSDLGALCVKWFPEGAAHLPQFDNLGICSLPPP